MENDNYLNTLADAHAEAFDFDQAIKWTNKAIELASDPRKEEYKTFLELYEFDPPYHQTPVAKR